MSRAALGVVVDRLERVLAQGDALSRAVAFWLGVGPDPLPTISATGVWVAREAALAGVYEASSGRRLARPFSDGLASLRGREYFIPHLPSPFEADPLAIFAVSIGILHTGSSDAGAWITDIARRARTGESDPWRVGLLRAAEGLITGSMPAALPPVLAMALRRKGLVTVPAPTEAAVLAEVSLLDETTADEAALRLAAVSALGALTAIESPPAPRQAQAATGDQAPMPKTNDETPRPLIGILTALPMECGAIRVMLDDRRRHQVPGEGAGRQYYLGYIPAEGGGRHLVVVALLPDMGNNSAAIRATQLLNHFPTVRHLIMCGIAGGVPRPGTSDDDVRLGDIVVSNRNGVVQYDNVKEHAGGWKESRHPPRPPGAELLEAVRHLQTEAVMGARPWEAFLPLASKIEKGMRPADDVDAKGNLITYPPDPERKPGLPRLFEGTIAASNTLLKNPAHRDTLGDTFKVKAVEMEGSGVADASWIDGAGYLVVRGICDYCDENKGDAWHGAAAIAAAAYVHALVASMLASASVDDGHTQTPRVQGPKPSGSGPIAPAPTKVLVVATTPSRFPPAPPAPTRAVPRLPPPANPPSRESVISRFQDLTGEARETLSGVDVVVVRVVFASLTGESWRPTQESWEGFEAKLQSAERSEYIQKNFDEDGFVTGSHPKMRKALRAVKDLATFMDSEEFSEVVDKLEEDEEIVIKITSEEFFNRFVNPHHAFPD